MKKYELGDRVNTEYGPGIVEAVFERIPYPYLVKINKFSDDLKGLKKLQKEQNGLFFNHKEISLLEKS